MNVVISATELRRVYEIRRGIFRAPAHLQAVGGISFSTDPRPRVVGEIPLVPTGAR